MTRTGGLLCGGTLIGENVFLTGAHCKQEAAKVGIAEDEIVVKTGVMCHTDSKCPKAAQSEILVIFLYLMRLLFCMLKDIEHFCYHSKFPGDPPSAENDIALLKLKPQPGQGLKVSSPCYPDVSTTRIEEGDEAIVVGCGRIPPYDRPKNLQQATLTVVEHELCKPKAPSTPTPRSIICTDGEASVCPGDSGGIRF